jgi:hypothetical protein
MVDAAVAVGGMGRSCLQDTPSVRPVGVHGNLNGLTKVCLSPWHPDHRDKTATNVAQLFNGQDVS